MSDGGHHENLGLESLLLRRCRVIITSDVTGDSRYEFRDFIRLLRRMRFEYGIRIVSLDGRNRGVSLDTLTPEELRASVADGASSSGAASRSSLADAHYIVARILYPDDRPDGAPREGLLIYAKPNFTGDEAVDLARYRHEDPAFPHDPTSDQFYDPQKYESYRQLGFYIGNTVCHDQFNECCNDEFETPLGQWSPSLNSTTDETGWTAGATEIDVDQDLALAKTTQSPEREHRPRPPR